MESITNQLRGLVAAHDNAVLQIYFLENAVHSLMMKMMKQVDDGHIIHGVQLAQRRCILEGVKQMFYLYQLRKWNEVQTCIFYITSQMPRHQHLHTIHPQQEFYESGSNPNAQDITLQMPQPLNTRHQENNPSVQSFIEMTTPNGQTHPIDPDNLGDFEPMDVVMIEEDMNSYFLSDMETLMDVSSSEDEEEEEEEEDNVYWSVGDDQYIDTIIRGLCLENCELHRSA